MKQRRWPELIKDYDYSMEDHLGKANDVANVLSKKSKHAKSSLYGIRVALLGELRSSTAVLAVERKNKWFGCLLKF